MSYDVQGIYQALGVQLNDEEKVIASGKSMEFEMKTKDFNEQQLY